ncbi:MAG: hypothetical protein ACD_66C00251G0001 [uncultured bacterium]|nr:MAG: hypothetical protein ACD_66C00251G0001 [uncultured bacterium]
MMTITTHDLIELFHLQPHPEGGYFSETYRAKESVSKDALPARFSGARSLSTAICYLLPEGIKSCLHCIKSDEVWHFYLGGPLTLVQISPVGKVDRITLGQDVLNGQKIQHVVPAGYWFGAYSNSGSEFSFVGCTVAPGFDFADFEIGRRDELLRLHPRIEIGDVVD